MGRRVWVAVLGVFLATGALAQEEAQAVPPELSGGAFPDFPWRNISPTFAGAGGLPLMESGDRPEASLNFWGGFAFHPQPAPLSLFIAVGTELNAVVPSSGTLGTAFAEFVPEVRTGLSLLRDPHTSYFNQTFPDLELYVIAGYRLPNPVRGGALRVGAGVSFLAIARWQIESFSTSFMRGVPLVPWMIDFVYDIQDEPAPYIRIGYQF